MVYIMEIKEQYIILDHFGRKSPLFVSAPPGFAGRKDGTIYRDGTDPKKSGPEWNIRRELAYKFKSHRSAARVASKCGENVKIVKVS